MATGVSSLNSLPLFNCILPLVKEGLPNEEIIAKCRSIFSQSILSLHHSEVIKQMTSFFLTHRVTVIEQQNIREVVSNLFPLVVKRDQRPPVMKMTRLPPPGQPHVQVGGGHFQAPRPPVQMIVLGQPFPSGQPHVQVGRGHFQAPRPPQPGNLGGDGRPYYNGQVIFKNSCS